MSCCHAYLAEPGHEGSFTVDASRITFGRGCLTEVGERARALGMKRAALFSDPRIDALEHADAVKASMRRAGVDVVTFTAVGIEPTDRSMNEAIAFARETQADGYVSLGGGSVIDTCKTANLFATHGGELLDHVNAPVGAAKPVPGPLAPHIACPTTSGTGSEVTGIAVFDLESLRAKTAIASHLLRPTEALVDPACADTLPSEVVAASGFDVLSHALESYTARPFTKRLAPEKPGARPMSQGANPWSDVGCREALELLGTFFARAVADAGDREARQQVMWAATLAGIAFGNAGVHVPHAMSYAVAGLVRDFAPGGYPADHPMVPHGMSVIVNAPAVFRFTARENPERHLEAAGWLGADVRGASPVDAGEVLAAQIVSIMQKVGMPNGIGGVGFTESDLDDLVRGTVPQARLLANAPRATGPGEIAELFRGALRYW